jgi:hypothetical protein
MCTNNNPLYLNIIFDETHPELIDLHENLQEYICIIIIILFLSKFFGPRLSAYFLF